MRNGDTRDLFGRYGQQAILRKDSTATLPFLTRAARDGKAAGGAGSECWKSGILLWPF